MAPYRKNWYLIHEQSGTVAASLAVNLPAEKEILDGNTLLELLNKVIWLENAQWYV